MPLAPGTRLGRYEIVAPLGEGGMGEVYRARDSKLGRTVAVKVIRRALEENADLRARFRREAEAIAALEHPHICVLHDVGESDGADFLVMEHLEGETLSERLHRGPLPLEQTVRYAIEIASALAAAHGHGFVHRDLKPGNVMLTAAGAKILDFGLAKPLPAGDAATALTTAPTATAPLTVKGTIVGTLGYMAPEQLEGREADARSDLFAMGALLHEMATGRKAFEAPTQAGLIAAVLTGLPARGALEERPLPPLFRQLVRKCLTKDREERWQSAADLVAALRWIGDGAAGGDNAAATDARRRTTRRAAAGLFAAALALAALAFLAGRTLRPGAPAASAPDAPVRLSILSPRGTTFAPRDLTGQAQFALSPDGARIAFVAASPGEPPRLWVRALASSDAAPLPGTEDATGPFWSPDGESVAFLAGGRLKRVAADGGVAAQDLAEATYHVGSGSWNRDGVILLSLGTGEGLYRVAASGGSLEIATNLDAAREETGHRWPQFLPDGRRFLVYVASRNPEWSGVYLGSLDRGEKAMLLRSMANAVWAEPGHLLFDDNSHLVAQRLDPEAGALTGERILLGDRIVGHWGPSFLPLSAAANGTLALWHGAPLPTELHWLDRSGRRIGDLGVPETVLHLALSPDATRLAVTKRDGNEDDLWRFDLATGQSSRITFSGVGRFAIWSPDGQSLVYSTRDALYRLAASGAGEETLVVGPAGHRAVFPDDWSRDARWLVYTASTRAGWDVRAIDTQSGETRTLLESTYNELQPRLSPNGEWLAYVSDESGAWEVYVQPFLEGSGKWQVSSGGGTQPQWRADGEELFYVTPESDLVAVPVAAGDTFAPGRAEPLFTVQMPPMLAPFRATYAPTPDGERFLVQTVVPDSEPSTVTVVLDWPAALTGQVEPTGRD